MKEMVSAWSILMGFMQIRSLRCCGGGNPEKNGSCDTGVLQRHP